MPLPRWVRQHVHALDLHQGPARSAAARRSPPPRRRPRGPRGRRGTSAARGLVARLRCPSRSARSARPGAARGGPSTAGLSNGSAAIRITAEYKSGHARATRGRDDPPPARARRWRGARWSASRCSTRAGASRRRPREVEDAVRGRRDRAAGRRGKYLICELEDEVHLVMHLRMTGNLLLRRRRRGRAPHLRVALVLDSRPAPAVRGRPPLRHRRSCCWATTRSTTYFDARLGVEPLSPEFTADALRALAHGRRAPVKAFLLNQERIAGVGNIYADEALFRAQHPSAATGRDAQAAADRGAARRRGGVARGGHRRQGRHDRRLPPRRRRRGLVSGPLPRLPARGRAVPALRPPDHQDARGGPGHVPLPQRSAQASRQGRRSQVASRDRLTVSGRSGRGRSGSCSRSPRGSG